jgi:hypothetical protein
MITIGRIVIYKLSENDVIRIDNYRKSKVSPANYNYVQKGDEYPLIVVKVWDKEFGGQPGVNGQLILDGFDTHWVTSAGEGNDNGQWHWPVIERAQGECRG